MNLRTITCGEQGEHVRFCAHECANLQSVTFNTGGQFTKNLQLHTDILNAAMYGKLQFRYKVFNCYDLVALLCAVLGCAFLTCVPLKPVYKATRRRL